MQGIKEITERYPVCPYCGNEKRNMDHLGGDGEKDIIECECGNDYEIEMSVSVEYTSRPIKEEPCEK